MKKLLQSILLILLACPFVNKCLAQTSWTGITSTNWATITNWTAGVPLATTDVIIGDANFTGAFQPTISATAAAKNITIGGAVLSQLTVSRTLSVKGAITIHANGTLVNGSASISLTGNWINNGAYSTTSGNATVIFNGLAQTLGGSTVTTFRKLTINIGSILQLTANVNCSGLGSLFNVNGTLNPGESPSYLTSADSLLVNNTAILKVNAAVFSSNYVISKALLLNAGSIVEYSATVTNQTISSSFTYSTLRITGAGTTKSLAANLPPLRSTSSGVGNISVVSGTLDLSTFTANRGTTVAGGTISAANGSFLKIGGTNTFPLNYNTNTFTLTSTVAYNGYNQAIAAKTYGNLILSSEAGSVIKTMPATAFTVAGSLTSMIGSGTDLSFTAAANITVNGIMTIGNGTTFNGANFSHAIANWVNSGTFTPATSTIIVKGSGSVINGTAVQNFYNLTISAINVSALAGIDLIITGNLATSGSGTFTHAAPGSVTMNGTSRTISGLAIKVNNLVISGTITTPNSFEVTGDLSVTGSLVASAGSITMSGVGKTITNSGTLTFRGLITSGSISTASNFSVSSSFNCSGSFLASAGTLTFISASSLSGTANLFNATLNGTSLTMASNAVMGIAGSFVVTTGTFYVTSYLPNTVNYNGSGAQTIKGGAYNNLVLSNGGIKTAAAAITINNALTISPSTTFEALTFTHTIVGNWINNGSFTAGTGTINFAGATNASIAGATTFYNIAVNKSLTTYSVSLLSNVTVSSIAMTKGSMKTGLNTLTITTTRTGNDVILGTITRTHAFTAGSYAFEGPNNTIAFAAGVSGVTSVTVNVVVAAVADLSGSVSRAYSIAIPTGTYSATLRLHYEDAELNGNDESIMQLWKYNGAAWVVSGKTTFNAASNYVEQSGLTNITDRWTFTDDGISLNWNGSVSSDWSTAANWSTLLGVPSSTAPVGTDIAQIGVITFANQPTISTVATVKNLVFGSAKAATLTMSSIGTLTASGSIHGEWTTNATHNIVANSRPITIKGDLVLSDDIAGHSINLTVTTGTVTVAGTITQSGGATIIFTAGTLSIGRDFNYSTGTFTGGTGTVKYADTVSQKVASVAYHNLTIEKRTGTIAVLNTATTISGNLLVTSGQLDVNSTLSVAGNLTIAAGAILDGSPSVVTVSGNWSKASTGTFIAGNGTVTFTGTNAQSVSGGVFNNFIVNKTSGAVTLTGNDSISGNLSLTAGTLNLTTFTINQTSGGGICRIANGTTLLVSGANNFPVNYGSYAISAGCLVHYNGTVAQAIGNVTYGNISFSNGGVLPKTFSASDTIKGNITINNGSSLDPGANTLTLLGDFNNEGNFIPSTSTIELKGGSAGLNKLINGATTFNNFLVNGSYATTPGSDMIYLGDVDVSGHLETGFCNRTFYGNSFQSGSISSDGTSTFMGTRVQYLRFSGTSSSPNFTSTTVFKGTITPISESTSSPTFINLEISNTSPAGLMADVPIRVLGSFVVSPGCTWNDGDLENTFSGSFTNNGTVISRGRIVIAPGPPLMLAPSTTVRLGSGAAFQSTGTVEFGGSGHVVIEGAPTSFNNVIISNSNISGVTPVSDWNMTGNFSVNSNAVFNGGSFTHMVGGNIECDGILNGNKSTFSMSSANGKLRGSPGTVFNNFTVAGTVESESDFYVSGDFTNNGTYNGSLGALTMTGPAPGSIGGTTNPSTIALLTINKTGNAVVTANTNISSISTFYIASGTFFTSTYSIAPNPAGSGIIIAAGGTLKLGGTNTIPAFSGYAFDVASTVDYAGTTQQVAGGPVYGNITFSAAGNKTAQNFFPLTIAGNLSITDGNFIANNLTHNLAGNWIMTGGTFDNTSSTIRFNGSVDQSIQTLAPFNTLAVSKPSGTINLLSDITVNAALNFTSGKIKTMNYAVILPAAGSITGAAQNTGWVRGNLQKNVSVGAGVSRTFQVGDSLYYSPATILFSTVSTAGNLRGSASSPDHPQSNFSGIDTAKSVNRYWSFSNAGIVFTTAGATFNWVTTDNDAGIVVANLKAAVLSAGNWTFTGVASPASTSIQVTGITAFGEYIVGERASQYVWTGDAFTSDWQTAMNWAGGVPTTSLNTVIPTGLTGGRLYPVLNSGTGEVKDIAIQSTAAMTVTGATLKISGSILNNGTFAAAAGTIDMNGSTPQVLPENVFLNNSILNLVINNNVTLAGPDTITGTLSFGSPGITLTTGDRLTLKSSAAGTARVAPMPVDGAGFATSFISGTVSVERYISNRRAWRLLTSPLSDAGNIYNSWQNSGVYQPGKGIFVTGPAPTVANGLDASARNTISLKTYNVAAQAFLDITNTKTFQLSNNTGNADNTGYFAFVRGDRAPGNLNVGSSNATTLKSTGLLQTGKQVFPASSTYNNVTLMGNPYASPVDFSNIQRTRILKRFYAWDPTLNQVGGYVVIDDLDGNGTYSKSVPSSALDKYIQSGQAFFVITDTAGAASLTYFETSKATTVSNTSFRPLGDIASLDATLNLLSGDGSVIVADALVAEFHESFSASVNLQDAIKFNNTNEMFSLQRNGVQLAIERRPLIVSNDTLFLRLTKTTARSYQVVINMYNIAAPGLIAMLEDKYTGTSTLLNMEGKSSINFTINSTPGSQNADRFRIVFLIAKVLPLTYTDVNARKAGEDVEVNWVVEQQINIDHYDVEKSLDGKNFLKVFSQVPTGNSTGDYTWLDANAGAGDIYYRLRNTDQDGSFAFSKVVKINIKDSRGRMVVFPNPVTDERIRVQFSGLPAGIYTARLVDIAGRTYVETKIRFNGSNGPQLINMPKDIAKGMYRLEVVHPGDASTTSLSVMKQ